MDLQDPVTKEKERVQGSLDRSREDEEASKKASDVDSSNYVTVMTSLSATAVCAIKTTVAVAEARR